MKLQPAVRRCAKAYRNLLKEWTTVEGGPLRLTLEHDGKVAGEAHEGVEPAAVDASLLHPPEPGKERGWLDSLEGRMKEWMSEWERRAGAARERLRERLLAVAKAGKAAAEGLLEGNLRPWNVWERMLDTGALKEAASGIGTGIGVAIAVVAIALVLSHGKGR